MKRRVLSYFRTIIELLFLPMRVIYFLCIKPIFRYLVQEEIKYEKDRYDDLLKKYREKSKEYNDNSKIIERLSKKLIRLESIFEYYKDWKFEISYTNKAEIVFLFSYNQNKLDSFYLCGINGSHHSNDCRIYLINYLDDMKIVDIISNTTNRGYARTLLEFTIKKAKELGVKKIYGDLSSVDSDSFDWLIPFYESLGFECTLFNDKGARMDGKIEMTLITTANSIPMQTIIQSHLTSIA